MVFNRNRIGRVVLLCLYCFLAQPHVVRCGECGGNVCDQTCRKGQWCYDRTWPLCNECKSCPDHTYNPDYDSGPVDDASDQCKQQQTTKCGTGEKLSADSKASKRICSACPSGQYKEGNNGETNCNLCVDTRQLAGYTSYGGSTSEGDCTYCDAGSGVNAARTKCIACWDDAYEHIKAYLEVVDPLLDDLTNLIDEFNMDDPTKV